MAEEKKHKPQVFDNVFKNILMYISHPALVLLINKLFKRDFPLDSSVTLKETESLTRNPGTNIKKLMSDMILELTRPDTEEYFLFEAQITDDEDMALRMFQYRLAFAIQNKRFEKVRNEATQEIEDIVRLRLPASKVFYLEPGKQTPAVLRCVITDGDTELAHDFVTGTVKLLEYSVGELVELGLTPLLPFAILAPRRQLKARRTSAEQRQALAKKFLDILEDIGRNVDKELDLQHITVADAELIDWSIRYIYRNNYERYSEFKEKYMGFYNTRMPRFKSKVNEALEKAHAFDLSLAKQGYTEDQMREAIAQKYPELAIA
jgi:hypothetical protein